jgi:MGT family glycosyltransferase
LEVSKALREMGYRALFAGDGEPLSLARKSGFEVRTLPDMDLEWALAHIGEKPEVLHPTSRIERWVEQELALLREVQPDAVLDDGRLTAGISAELFGLPRISIVNAYFTPYAASGLLNGRLPGPPSIVRRGTERPYNRVRASYGLSSIASPTDLLVGDLNLMCDVPEYAPVRGAPPNYRYVGPLTWNTDVEQPDWLERLDPDRPTVYFTMGSTGPTEAFQLALRAFDDAAYQVLMTVGVRADLEGLLPAPSHCHVSRYAPGDELACRADVVVCHAGNGTTYQALQAGKPIVAWPFVADQQWNARRQAELGVGLTLPEPTPQALRRAVREVLDDPRYRAAAQSLQRMVTSYDGPRTAAHVIDELIS